MIRSVLAAACAGALLGACATPPPTLDLTTDEWREDLECLVQEIEEEHLSPWHHVSREEFMADVDALRADLPSLASYEVTVRFLALTARIGDGHTGLQPWPLYGGLPLGFYWFGDEFRVTHSDDAHREWLGWQVVAIGGVPIPEVHERLAVLAPARESPTHELSWTQGMVRRCEVLATFGLCEGPDAATLTFRNDAGEEREATLQAVPPLTNWTGFHQARKTVPLSAENWQQPLWFTRVPDTGIVYFHFHAYPQRDVVERMAELLDFELRKPGVTRLLVDFRENGGGDFTKGQMLIETIQDTVRERGIGVDVAIGRYTFSAAMSNACHFHDAFDARYLGETSGARPNGYQETGAFDLPNSRIRGSTAQEYYRFQDEDTDGVEPDVHLPPDWKTYLAGGDPVLDFVVAEDRARGGTE